MTSDDTDALISALWEQFRPLVAARIAAIEQYVAGAAESVESTPAHERRLTALRSAAQDAAHNLAGGLGSYGRSNGSRIAGELDAELRQPVDDLAVITGLVEKLRVATVE